MEKACISIIVKKNFKKTQGGSIDVQYDTQMGERKIVELGDVIASLNKSATVTIEYSVFSEISATWLVIRSYYADVKRLVKH